MTLSQKETIDNMGYEEMLRLWRFAPCGEPLFTGDTGDYYAKIMAEKKETIGAGRAVAASKNIGLEK